MSRCAAGEPDASTAQTRLPDQAATKKRRSEFATLHAHEANLRLMGADRILEHLGLRTRLTLIEEQCRAALIHPGPPQSPALNAK